jgi:hypothetical protein
MPVNDIDLASFEARDDVKTHESVTRWLRAFGQAISSGDETQVASLFEDEGNWRDVLAPIVICAANVAMSDDIEHKLCDAGKTVVTDFVANCGGVVGSMMDRAVDKGVIWDILNTSYRGKIAGFQAQSLSSGESIGSLARREANRRMASWAGAERAGAETLKRWLGKMVPRGARARRQRQHYADLWAAQARD